MVTPEQFDGNVQAALDHVIETNGHLHLGMDYALDEGLVATKLEDGEYKQLDFKLTGGSRMGDTGKGSKLSARFSNGNVLSIQEGKGVFVKGIEIVGPYKSPSIDGLFEDPAKKIDSFTTYGDPNCAPDFTGICIDPFYDGVSKGGSTGLTFENVKAGGVAVGFMISPNKSTQNADCLAFRDIEIGECKVGFAGCQPQEKGNIIERVKAWKRLHTLFAFGRYGACKPGQWMIRDVNVAGDCYQIVHRNSGEYAPLFMDNIQAESIRWFGRWDTVLNDRISNSIIKFKDTGRNPFRHHYGDGVDFSNTLMRYYEGGDSRNWPIIMGSKKYTQVTSKAVQVDISEAGEARISMSGLKVNDTVGFLYSNNGAYRGFGVVAETDGTTARIVRMSNNLFTGKYHLGI